MFTRPFRRIRYLKPKNIIGNLTGYGNCECGNSLRYDDNPGYMTSYHGGRCICNDCYETFKKEIERHNHKSQLITPVNMADGSTNYGFLVCNDENCEVHKDDGRFIWNGKNGWEIDKKWLK